MNHASDFAATLVIRCGVMLGCLLPGVSLYAQGTQQDKATPPGAAQRDAVASGSPSDLDPSADSMRALIQRYVSDRANLIRFHAVRGSTRRAQQLESFYEDWLTRLAEVEFDQLCQDGRVDYLLLKNELQHELRSLAESLKFHLEEMSPEEAVDFLVANVGHERRNATAEVRRSVEGNYGPLYQAAYMLGGLQLRTLQRELVQSGQLTNRQFHDRILKENSIPIEMIRASLTGRQLARDHQPGWRFYDLTEAGQQ